MGFLSVSIIFSRFPQMEGSNADDLRESRSKPRLRALEKSSLQVAFAQVWKQASTAISKPSMGYVPASC